jgi:carbon monoxide dehydrogenase subunit G
MGANTAFTASEQVFVPPERAWALLTDWAAAPAWMPGVNEMHAEGPLAVGQSISFHSQGHDRSSTVTELDVGRCITITSSQGDVRADYRYELGGEAGATRLTLTADVVVSEELAAMAEQIRRAIAEADSGQLASFKRFAEAAP